MNSTCDIVINGRFLSQRLSGVQRYAREIVAALDRLIAADPSGLGVHRWRIAVPPAADPSFGTTMIERVEIGSAKGHLWEQYELGRYARGSRLINLCNSGPILHSDSFVVIHDAAPYRTPANFGRTYGIFHRALGRILARTARLGTVSLFSRRELARIFNLGESQIFIAGNGCDHFLPRRYTEGVAARIGVETAGYFLFVGSPAPNKNLTVVIDAFRSLERADVSLVIAGSLNKAVFGGTSLDTLPGIIVAEGLPDEDIAGLYRGATALIFPSRYEGFGIPPLEAMACGCPVIASDIPVLNEVCDDAATYFDPNDPDALAQVMTRFIADPAQRYARLYQANARVSHYTWSRAASSLAAAVVAR